MLLIDGVKYEEWIPSSEDEFEAVVKEHTQEIFGYSIYLDRKQKLKSLSGIGSIPDGYVVTLWNKPEVQIIELELASHTLQHIVAQIVNIINGIENPATQRKICNAIEDGINQYDIFAAMVAEAIKPTAIHRFLSDSFSNAVPKINIIIDKGSPALEEAINKIVYPHRIIEFRTFIYKTPDKSTHAHLFEPMFQQAGSLGNQKIISTEEREWPRARGLKQYIKDGKHYNPMEALVALGATLNRMVEGRGDRRATMPDGTILEYVGSTKNGKSKIAKVHTYLLNHGFTFSQEK